MFCLIRLYCLHLFQTDDSQHLHGHSASMEAMDLIADEPTQFNIPEEQVQSYFIRADSERPSSRQFDDPLRRLGMYMYTRLLSFMICLGVSLGS